MGRVKTINACGCCGTEGCVCTSWAAYSGAVHTRNEGYLASWDGYTVYSPYAAFSGNCAPTIVELTNLSGSIIAPDTVHIGTGPGTGGSESDPGDGCGGLCNGSGQNANTSVGIGKIIYLCKGDRVDMVLTGDIMKQHFYSTQVHELRIGKFPIHLRRPYSTFYYSTTAYLASLNCCKSFGQTSFSTDGVSPGCVRQYEGYGLYTKREWDKWPGLGCLLFVPTVCAGNQDCHWSENVRTGLRNGPADKKRRLSDWGGGRFYGTIATCIDVMRPPDWLPAKNDVHQITINYGDTEPGSLLHPRKLNCNEKKTVTKQTGVYITETGYYEINYSFRNAVYHYLHRRFLSDKVAQKNIRGAFEFIVTKAEGEEDAGYPPNCNEGYVEKDGQCVPIEDSGCSRPECLDAEYVYMSSLTSLNAYGEWRKGPE